MNEKNTIIRKDSLSILKIFGVLVIAFSALICALRAGLPIQVIAFCAISYLFIKTLKSVLYSFRYRDVVSVSLAAVLSTSWLLFPSMIVQDITAICLAAAVFYQAYEAGITLRDATLMAAAIIPFDILMVFGTGFMIEFVTHLNASATPLALSVSPGIRDVVGLSVLGLGDIILPGIVILTAWTEEKERKLPFLGVGALVGYFVGLFVVIVAVNFFQYPQPATLYLYPGVFLGIWAILLKNHVSWAYLYGKK